MLCHKMSPDGLVHRRPEKHIRHCKLELALVWIVSFAHVPGPSDNQD